MTQLTENLTQTERKVAHGISQGLIEKEMADRFCVSVHTIHTHSRNIRRKLNARNIADITRMYILSLEDPKLVLKAMLFLVLQAGMMSSGVDFDMRKPAGRNNCRVVRTAGKSKSKTKAYYA